MRRRQDLFIPPVALDRTAPETLHHQLYRQLARALAGTANGTRLPSTRLWAKFLGVSRNTVLAVYEELAADGLIRGSQGAGMYVCAGAPTQQGWRQVIRAAHYPSRTAQLPDPDGNPLYLNF